MEVSELFQNLKPSFYSFDVTNCMIKKIIDTSVPTLEYTAEFIRIYRKLKDEHIEFFETTEGDLQIVA
jgi:hypothetical protein